MSKMQGIGGERGAQDFILKGDVVYSLSQERLFEQKDALLVCVGGRAAGVYPDEARLPEAYCGLPVKDYSGHLIVPGLYDLHLHAPQYQFRGLWMDLELLDWLSTHAFPEEARFAEPAFARKAYGIFAQEMRSSATARFSAFATLHTDATLLLMDLMEESGLCGYIGKVNMDRNAARGLQETTEESIAETRRWLKECAARGYKHILPILTPRFIPSCTDELMRALGSFADRIPLQSHLSENPGEIQWVKELCPWSDCYGDAYAQAGCFGGEKKAPVIMAHCVWSNEEERELMKRNKVFIAHCPASNTNLASGIAPIRRYLSEGLHVGLGTDIAGGTSRSIFRAMTDAVQVSKLYFRYVDREAKPLSLPEAFYLATKGGGDFFGKCGSFETGYAFDALVLDESKIPTPLDSLSPAERLERFAYLADDRDVLHKYVEGRMLF